LKLKIEPHQRKVHDFLRHVAIYEDQIKDTFHTYILNDSERLKGFCTAEGTQKYYDRSQSGETVLDVHPDNFKSPLYKPELKISSIGYGTYMGDPDDYTDFCMYDSIKQAAMSGAVNHFDTAPNFRYSKSEKTIGKALNTLCRKYNFSRDEFFLTSKVGFIPEDVDAGIS